MDIKYGSFLTKFSQSADPTNLDYVCPLNNTRVDWLNEHLPKILALERANDLAGSVASTFFRVKDDIESLLMYISHPLLGGSTYIHSSLNNEMMRILNSFKLYLDHAEKNINPNHVSEYREMRGKFYLEMFEYRFVYELRNYA